MQMKNQSNNKKRLFVDLDGTAAEWRHIEIELDETDDADSTAKKLFDVLQTPGYYFSLKPNKNVVNAVKLLVERGNIEVFVLSCYPEDGKKSSPRREKNAWVTKYLPEIDEAHRIFVPYGKSKVDYVPGGIKEDDTLLDDKTSNLTEFENAGGNGIKLLNNVNSTYGTWRGNQLNYLHSGYKLANCLEKIILKNYSFSHLKPDRNNDVFNYKDFDFSYYADNLPDYEEDKE